MCLWSAVFIWRVSASYKNIIVICVRPLCIYLSEKNEFVDSAMWQIYSPNCYQFPSPTATLIFLCVCVCVCALSCVQLFATPSTAAHQTPLSLEFSRQEHWNGLLFPSLGFLPDPRTKPGSSALQAHSLSSEPPGKPFLCFYIFTFPYH